MALHLIKFFQTNKEGEQVSKRDIRFFLQSRDCSVGNKQLRLHHESCKNSKQPKPIDLTTASAG